MLRIILRYRRLLASMTRVELGKRHAGSILGMVWVILQPALLLSVYLFVYMVVFQYRFPGFSRIDYVLYVFCGLVPYLGFMEALTTGALSIKQNMHLVKNVMLPIELIPVRSVIVGMASQFVSIALVLLLVTANGVLSWHVLWLPAVVVLQVMWLVGLTWILSSLTVAAGYHLLHQPVRVSVDVPVADRLQAGHVAEGIRLGPLCESDLLHDRDVSRQHALRPVAVFARGRRVRGDVSRDVRARQRLL